MKTLKGGLINTITLENNIVKKTYSDDSLIKGLGYSSKQRMSNEARALAMFEKNEKIKVPRLIKTSLADREIWMEYIDGDPLENLIRNSQAAVKKFFRPGKIAEMLHAIHAPCEESVDHLGNEYLERVNKYLKNSREILLYEGIPVKILSNLFNKYFTSKQFLRSKASYIHSDFWFDNLIGQKDGQMTVIDWEFFRSGFFYEDFGAFFVNIEMHFSHLKDFCNKTYLEYDPNINKKLIMAFGIFRCVRLLSFISLNTYKESSPDYPHSFKELISIIKKVYKLL